jgi:hypothetical protein
MLGYRLICPCGYKSNSAPSGSEISHSDYSIPVVIEDDERLYHIEIKQPDNESDELFFERLDSAIQLEIEKRFGGRSVVIMTPMHSMGDLFVRCPRCKQTMAKFQFAGW